MKVAIDEQDVVSNKRQNLIKVKREKTKEIVNVFIANDHVIEENVVQNQRNHEKKYVGKRMGGSEYPDPNRVFPLDAYDKGSIDENIKVDHKEKLKPKTAIMKKI